MDPLWGGGGGIGVEGVGGCRELVQRQRVWL